MFRCDETFIINDPQGAYKANRRASIVTVFLCPKCDDTHLQITFADGTCAISLSLDPKTAEAIGQQLVNPAPANHSSF